MKPFRRSESERFEQQIENKLYNRKQRGQVGAETIGENAPPGLCPTISSYPIIQILAR